MLDDFRRTLYEHLKARHLREQAQGLENTYKERAKKWLQEVGDEDEKGNRWWYPAPGSDLIRDPDGNAVESVKLERRAPVILDEEAAEEILRDLGFWEACTVKETIVTLDEDAILALNFEGKLSDDDLQKMYTDGKVTWAFKVNKEK